jgi:hypothetical protein
MPHVTAIADNGHPEATMKAHLLHWLHMAVQHKDGHWQHWIWKQQQVQDDGGRTKATGIVFLGRARTNMPNQGSKEVGIYVPADVDDEDNAI